MEIDRNHGGPDHENDRESFDPEIICTNVIACNTVELRSGEHVHIVGSDGRLAVELTFRKAGEDQGISRRLYVRPVHPESGGEGGRLMLQLPADFDRRLAEALVRSSERIAWALRNSYDSSLNNGFGGKFSYSEVGFEIVNEPELNSFHPSADVSEAVDRLIEGSRKRRPEE
ncbi:MAG: hypothetical protein D6719_05055 [Candidatus Dadabacteria bacterium]|nr:MAG: hypothetical protein D6719_05055 [Candidatus Dadabacteria bacterium]